MESRVLGTTPEETTAAVTTSCGIGTSSPVATAPINAVPGVAGASVLTSATCTIQNPVVVVASPPTKHQQSATVLSTIPTVPAVPSVSGVTTVTAAVPKILSRNVNGTRKSLFKFLSPFYILKSYTSWFILHYIFIYLNISSDTNIDRG
ncbi:hypothetical protein K0M31_015689 [Melipona bicolor]|uniref:Uncharacterized protein n=1 Tax=Melipona bicolor TaxID=60889 RepID=A0AA40KF27_9HYME|nr:hypothetical protein K0M31_015689 [Melipona bicolor]